MGRGWKKILVVANSAALCSCAATPYAEVGIGHSLGDTLDDGNHTRTYFEAGLEFADGSSCGIQHISHPLVGVPFNSKPDDYLDTVLCRKRVYLK